MQNPHRVGIEFMLLHALYHIGLVIQKKAQELKTLKKSLSQPLCMISTAVIVQPHPRHSHMLERCSSSFELPLCETWLSFLFLFLFFLAIKKPRLSP